MEMLTEKEAGDRKWFALAATTISGRIIPESDETREQYPVRNVLTAMSQICWTRLHKNRRTKNDVAAATAFIEDEFQVLAKWLSQPKDQDDEWYTHGPMWQWFCMSCIQYALPQDEETCERWLPQLPRSTKRKREWDWYETEILLSLIAIDRAIRHLEEGLPFKAATWVAHATEALVISRWMKSDIKNDKTPPNAAPALSAKGEISAAIKHAVLSANGKKGAWVKHKPDREDAAEAIKMYKTGSYTSKDKAAEEICAKIGRSFGITRKWLREPKTKSLKAVL